MKKSPYAFLGKYGVNGDDRVAHINGQEARLLKMLGGSGKPNPVTGLEQYERGSSSGEGAGAGGGRGGEGAGGGGNDPFGPDGFGNMGDPFGGIGSNPNAVGVDAGPMDLSNDSPAGVGLGPSMSSQQAVDATLANVTPTMNQMQSIIEAGKINQANRPGFGNVVQGLAGFAAPGFGLAAAGLGLANNAGLSFDGPSPQGSSVGGDAGGGGGAGPNEGGGREGPNDYGLLSPRPAGGLADATPEAGLEGFRYTNPLTNEVEIYRGGLLPWQRPDFV